MTLKVRIFLLQISACATASIGENVFVTAVNCVFTGMNVGAFVTALVSVTVVDAHISHAGTPCVFGLVVTPRHVSSTRMFLFLFCFCSKCCRESSRYNFFPFETFLGGKHFSLRTF